MTDFFAPSDVDAASASWRLIANTLAGRSPTVGTIRTAEKLGDAWGLRLKWPKFKDESATLRRRSRILSFASRLRGHANRVLLPIPGYTGPSWAPELLSNNTFASDSTWAVGGGEYAFTVQDRVARFTRTAVSLSQDVLVPNAAATVVAFAPYAARVLELPGRGSFTSVGLQLGTTSGAQDVGQSFSAVGGLKTLVGVPTGTSLWFGLVDLQSSGLVAGDYYQSPYVSLSRCALVDNAPNLLLQSDDFTTTWVNTRSTDAANATVAPDGTTTADSIIEDGTASNTHYIDQGATVASTALDYSFTVCLKAGTRSFAQISMIENTSSHQANVDVNLTTGAIGAPGVDANWTNPRAFIRDVGNGWYAVTIVARKASAATVVTARVYLATALGTVSYSGDGASLIYAWRATLAQSSVPTRLSQTTTTASTGTAQSGVGLHTKGWPISTSGLRLEGHWIEIGGAFYQLTGMVNSDAAGLAWVPLNRPPRIAPADNAPIIVNNPLSRFLLEENQVAWEDTPGVFSELELPFIEDVPS